MPTRSRSVTSLPKRSNSLPSSLSIDDSVDRLTKPRLRRGTKKARRERKAQEDATTVAGLPPPPLATDTPTRSRSVTSLPKRSNSLSSSLSIDDSVNRLTKPRLRRGTKKARRERKAQEDATTVAGLPPPPLNTDTTADMKGSLDSSKGSSSMEKSFYISNITNLPSEDLEFLTRSPVGHQFRNKKLWRSNVTLHEKRYQKASGRGVRKSFTNSATIEREMRRHDIRAALMGALDDL